jgi:hypothetical protein
MKISENVLGVIARLHGIQLLAKETSYCPRIRGKENGTPPLSLLLQLQQYGSFIGRDI